MNNFIGRLPIPLKDNPDIQWELGTSLVALEKLGLLSELKNCLSIMSKYKGASGLINYWVEKRGKRNIEAEMEQARPAVNEGRVISILDEQAIQENLDDFKKALRKIINGSKFRGVSKVARLCGLAQPALSRLLYNDSLPRRGTLEKLSNGLKITQIDLDDPLHVGERYTKQRIEVHKSRKSKK